MAKKSKNLLKERMNKQIKQQQTRRTDIIVRLANSGLDDSNRNELVLRYRWVGSKIISTIHMAPDKISLVFSPLAHNWFYYLLVSQC